MHWHLSWRADPRAKRLADRHYNRQNPESDQFVPPGRCIVLLTEHADALWITSWPFAKYVKHAWAGAWTCSAFRNESSVRSSDLIRDAVAATRAIFGPPPKEGFVTFVDETKVRHKRDPGRCYLKAGWTYTHTTDDSGRIVRRTTEGGLVVLRLFADWIGRGEAPIGHVPSLLDRIAYKEGAPA